jgi:hypothetical protein
VDIGAATAVPAETMWLVVAGIAGTAKATLGRGHGVDQMLVNAA